MNTKKKERYTAIHPKKKKRQTAIGQGKKLKFADGTEIEKGKGGQEIIVVDG